MSVLAAVFPQATATDCDWGWRGRRGWRFRWSRGRLEAAAQRSVMQEVAIFRQIGYFHDLQKKLTYLGGYFGYYRAVFWHGKQYNFQRVLGLSSSLHFFLSNHEKIFESITEILA